MYRKLKQRWRRSTWPLALICGPREKGDLYQRGFETLRDALVRKNIVAPEQVNLDWFSGSRSAAERAWGHRVNFKRGNEHLRRNLKTNQSAATKTTKRKAKAKAKGKARPRRRQSMPKQDEDKRPPHMESGKLWAFLGLQSRLIFAPSESFFHVCMEAVLNRARIQWNEASWCSYFEKWYMSNKTVDEKVLAEGQILTAHWWSGAGSSHQYQPLPPPSQQPAEQMNAKFKRDIRRLGPLRTHQDVVDMLVQCLKMWTAPLSPSDAQTDCPLTLMGAGGDDGLRFAYPLSPDGWMQTAEGCVMRPPFTEKTVKFPGIATVLHKMKNNRKHFPHQELKIGSTRRRGSIWLQLGSGRKIVMTCMLLRHIQPTNLRGYWTLPMRSVARTHIRSCLRGGWLWR